MKSKKTNILLGVIAINLTLLTFIQLEIWPTKANATNDLGLDPSINYGLVPLNENGSIDVNISSSSTMMDINLTHVRGTKVWCNTSLGSAVLGAYVETTTLTR